MIIVLPDSKCSQKLKDIQQYWKQKSDAYGDVGSCVVGAGFEFVYRNKKYFMPPISKWQGSISWEHCINKIEEQLRNIGCKHIHYNWGRLD